MSSDDHHEAFKFLHGASVPDEKRIDAMSEAELDEHLATQGIDVSKLNQKIGERKLQLAGRLALLAARRRRLAELDAPEPDIQLLGTKEEIIQAIRAKFGDELPLAAQKFRGMDYAELGQLYRDLIAKRPQRPDGG